MSWSGAICPVSDRNMLNAELLENGQIPNKPLFQL